MESLCMKQTGTNGGERHHQVNMVARVRRVEGREEPSGRHVWQRNSMQLLGSLGEVPKQSGKLCVVGVSQEGWVIQAEEFKLRFGKTA